MKELNDILLQSMYIASSYNIDLSNHYEIKDSGKIINKETEKECDLNDIKFILSNIEDTMENLKKIEDTEAVAEANTVETPQTPAEAEAPKIEETKIDPAVELPTLPIETKTIETKDSLPIIDTAKIFNDGLAKATKDYINVIKFIDAGLITSKEAINGNPQDLIDKALEKVYNKKIEDVAIKDSYIDLAVANLNKKHWNFNDTKSVVKANDGVFINNLYNK